MATHHFKYLLLIPLLFLASNPLFSQCFRVLDGNGVFNNSNPYWINCTPGSYNLILQTDIALGAYTVNWGDGNTSSGTSLTPPAFLQHTYASTTDTFNVTIVSAGCTINGVVVLERNPLASIQLPAGDDNFGCTPVLFRFINSSTQISETTVFRWDFGDGSPTETYDYTNLGDTINHVYMPGIGVLSCDLEVTLVATNYCGSSTASFFPLKVWDLDEAVITPSATLLCYPDTVVQYTNNTIRNCYPEGNITQRYEYWNFGDYWGKGYDSIIGWRPWNPPIINPPPMAYPGVGTYSVTLIDSSFCGRDTTSISITITSPPTAVISPNKDSICAGESITFINASYGGANVYSWNFGQGAGWQNLSASNKTRTFNSAGNYTVGLAVSVAGAAGCSDTSYTTIYVNPSPTSDFTFDNNNACDSMLVNFTDNSTSAIYWRWDFGNGNSYLGQNPPAQKYTAAAAYDVQLYTRNSNGCADSITKTLNVYKTPQVGFTATSVCVNELVAFMDTSTSVSGDPIIAWSWDFGNGNTSVLQDPSTIYTTAGTYTIILEVFTAHCSAIDSMQLTVENLPTAAFSADISKGCSPLTVNFTNNSSSNASKFRWNFGDGSPIDTAKNPTHIFSNTQINDTNYIVTLIASTTFGCADTIRDTINVNPIPVPNFTSDAVVDCGPITVNFTNLTLGDSLNYLWSFGDSTATTTVKNPTHIFENKSLFINNYNVSLIVFSKNGCTDTISKVITVNPEPIFNFTTIPDSGCSPLRVQFPVVVGAVSYQWDFGDSTTSTGANPAHVFVNNTTNNKSFRVQLIAQNSFGCKDTTEKNVLVYPNPTAIFSTDTFRGCQPLPIEITNSSIGANVYLWDYGDGSSNDTSDAVFTKTYSNNTAASVNRTIRLITQTTLGCSDTSTRVIEIYPRVIADFTSDSIGCSPLKVSFSNQSIGASGGFEWFFGDGVINNSVNPNHYYINHGLTDTVYTAKLRARSPQQCVDSMSRNIRVHAKPQALFSMNSFNGCQPLDVQFTNNSIISDSCSWQYGDGNFFNSCNPISNHTFYNLTSIIPINYTTDLKVYTSNGCADTMSQLITVKPQVIADFTFDTADCSPFPVTFRSQSFGGMNYNWNFGDGGSATGLITTHTYYNTSAADTIFDISLIVKSVYDCYDTMVNQITVRPTPLVNFDATPNTQLFPNTTVNLVNNTNPGAWNYNWDFGDTSTSSLQVPGTHIYKHWGQYKIWLKASSAYCSDSIFKQITILPPIPVAAFNDSASGCEPLEVQFINESIYADQFIWDFGDRGTSTQRDPKYIYNTPGTYSVTLRAIGDGGEDLESKTSYIKVYPRADAYFTINKQANEKFYIPNDPLVCYNRSNGADSYIWDFGDGNTSTDSAAVHYYTVPGEYEIMLIAVSQNGCSDTFKLDRKAIAELDGRIIVPNAFTPNSSGPNGGIVNHFHSSGKMNDVFYPLVRGAAKYELNIFNKWGELLFVSKDQEIGWDGYYRGKLCKQDTYVWKIKAEFIDGKTYVEAGDLLLLR